MAPLAIRLDSATLVLKIGNKNYELKAPSQELTLPSGTTGNLNAHLKLVFHESYENAINVGTPATILTEVETVLGPALDLAGSTGSLAVQWNQFKDQIRLVPVLNQVAADVLDTQIAITDIVVDLVFTRPVGGTATFAGTFSLGLLFTPDQSHPPRLFNATLTRFGAILTVQLKGNASDNVLGFTWPNP